MALWQYKVIEIVATKVIHRYEAAIPRVQRRAGGSTDNLGHIPLKDVEGWHVKGLPRVWDSLQDLFDEYGQEGWELVNVTPTHIGGSHDDAVHQFRVFFKAPA